MKKLFGLLAVLCAASCIFGCASQSDPTAETDPTTGSAGTEATVAFPSKNNEAGYLASLEEGVLSASVKEMTEKAQDVVIANVVDERQWVSEPSGLENAESDIVIEQVLKGNLSAGDRLTIHETGWRDEDHDTSIGGEPLLGNGMRAVLFLSDEGAIMACYQGKIFIDNDGTAYPYTYFTGESGEFIPFTDMQSPMPLDDVIGIVTES